MTIESETAWNVRSLGILYDIVAQIPRDVSISQPITSDQLQNDNLLIS